MGFVGNREIKAHAKIPLDIFRKSNIITLKHFN